VITRRFEDVEPGHFYMLCVSRREYSFSQHTLAFTLTEDVSNLIFTADAGRKDSGLFDFST
jgi:hypothetical protein